MLRVYEVTIERTFVIEVTAHDEQQAVEVARDSDEYRDSDEWEEEVAYVIDQHEQALDELADNKRKEILEDGV